MHPAIPSSNISSPSLPQAMLQAFELLTINLFKYLPSPPSGKSLCFNAWANFFVQGHISDSDLLHIDKVLKPRPCRPFLLSHSLAKWNYLPWTPQHLKIQLLHSTCIPTPPQQGKVQISHPPRHRPWSNAGELPKAGGRWSFKFVGK